jgi:teichoic acid transport system permease protein
VTADGQLFDIGRPLSLRAYLADLWRHRQLTVELARADLKQRHVDTALGNVWYFLNPLFLTAIYFAIFGVILDTSRGMSKNDFIPYLTIGVGLFRFAQRGAMAGAKSLIINQRLIRLIRFPRAILPISGVLAELGSVGPAIVVGMVVALLAGKNPGFDWLLVVPAAVLLALFVTGIAFLAARAAEASGDVINLLPWVFRILFYLSGVIFSVDKFITTAWHRDMFLLVPFHPLLSLARYPFVPDASPVTGYMVLAAFGWTTVALVVGLWFFRRGEANYGRE